METTLFEILTALFAGCNVLQFVFWRQTKQKTQAEADGATVDVQQKIKDLHTDAYEDLVERLNKYQNDYFDLGEKVQQMSREFTEKITSKCNEIAELKSQVIYFKGLRCYKSDCSLRIGKNPKDKQEEQNEDNK